MELSQTDKRISYAQAWNLAVAICAEHFSSQNKPSETQKEILENWQAYFYDMLTKGYIEKFAPYQIPLKQVDIKKSEDQGIETAELDTEQEIQEV